MRLAWVGLVLAMLIAGEAHAVIECTNDDDCATSTCGGKVCNWIGADHLCQDPTGAANEGWCSTGATTHCKCSGATCIASPTPHCSFTRPQDAPDMTAPPPDLLPPPPDLKAPPDLLPPPPDLLPPPDLTGVAPPDLTAGPEDLTAAAVDQSVASPDASMTSDMAKADQAAATPCDHDT